MAFGIKREELLAWKQKSAAGQISFLTHFWLHPRYPTVTTVTKVGCADLDKLAAWGKQYGLKEEWIHKRSTYSHFDLIGDKQKEILQEERLYSHIKRFGI